MGHAMLIARQKTVVKTHRMNQAPSPRLRIKITIAAINTTDNKVSTSHCFSVSLIHEASVCLLKPNSSSMTKVRYDETGS